MTTAGDTEPQALSNRSRRPGRSGAIMWLLAVAATAGLVCWCYLLGQSSHEGVDFGYFLAAARNVAAGHSPYLGQPNYVYPPLLAIVLAPVSHANPHSLWDIWTVVVIAAALLGAITFVVHHRRAVTRSIRPAFLIFCVATVLSCWPMRRELELGQSDTFVFLTLVLAAVAADRPKPGRRGAWIGFAGLIKGWPALIGVTLLAPLTNLTRNRRQIPTTELTAFALVLLIAPLLALITGGASGVSALVKNGLDAPQPSDLVNDSVWGAPKLLFSHTGLAHPLLISTAAQIAVTALLATWVATLLIISLGPTRDPSLALWNTIFCLILLLPIAHRQYALYVLPLLWIAVLRVLSPGNRDRRQLATVAVLAGWWIIQTLTWPYSGSSPSISAIRYTIPFFADLAACTVTVTANRRRTTLQPTSIAESAANPGLARIPESV